MFEEERYAEARAAARGLLARAQSERGPESTQALEALNLLVESFWRWTAPDKREELDLANRAVSLAERLGAAGDTTLATALFNLANLRRKYGRLEEAKPLFQRVLAIRKERLPPNHPGIAVALNATGNACRDVGDFYGAVSYFEPAVEAARLAWGPRHPRFALVLMNLGNALRDLGDLDGARKRFEESVLTLEQSRPPRQIALALALNNLANTVADLGDYSRARDLFQRAISLRSAGVGRIDSEGALYIGNLGLLLLSMGDGPAARAEFERAVRGSLDDLGPTHERTLWCMGNLAGAYEAEGDLARSERLRARVLRTVEGSVKPDDYHLADPLSGLGSNEVARGRYPSALRHLRRALSIRTRALGPRSVAVAQTLTGLAELYERSGDPGHAIRYRERALAIYDSLGVAAHPDAARTLQQLARLRYAGGDRAGCLRDALRAENIGREHARRMARSLPERMALRYASVRGGGLDAALSLAADGLDSTGSPAVRDALIRSRALVLDEMVARHRSVLANGDPEVARIAKDLARVQSRLANLWIHGLDPTAASRPPALIERAKAEEESLETSLASRSAEFRAEQALGRSGASEVDAAMPPGTAMVSYAVYERLRPGSEGGEPQTLRSYLALVRTLSPPGLRVIPLGGAASIDRLVAAWRREAEQGPDAGRGRDQQEALRAYWKAGTALRRAVWDPVRSGLGRATRVFVVPDGALQLVSWNALPDDDGTYLVESGPLIHCLSSERDVLTSGAPWAESSEPTRGGLLAFGGPLFDAQGADAPSACGFGGAARLAAPAGASPPDEFRVRSPECAPFSALRFDSLPGSRAEAEEVATIWNEESARSGSATLAEAGTAAARAPGCALTGRDASEAAFRLLAPGRAVLHIATHGFYLGPGCGRALPGGRGIGGTAPIGGALPPPESENPLLLSGLALAGANLREPHGGDDDGILTAEEIGAIDLGSVQWAVVSACESGLGEVQDGEGVLGFKRALQVAGVRTTILSLWPVGDAETRRWMRALYEARLRDGLGAAESTREASLEVLRECRARGEGTHPFTWGAFVASGDWR